MLSFECIKNEKSVYFLLTSANTREVGQQTRRRSTDCQNQVRGKSIHARKKPINCLTDTEKCVTVITVSIFMT